MPALSHRTRVVVWWCATAAVVVSIALLGLYARGGGSVPAFLSFLSPSGPDYLAASGPAESVLRTLRLAGYERAVAGMESGTAFVRIELPSVASPADVELGWQSGIGALATAYPNAGPYVVQLFGPGQQALLEVSIPGEKARAAVGANDGLALRAASTFHYLAVLEGDGG
ncbi:MAG: hypothetical protein C0418_06055 [Coriobacteriaceae bacterium]|nr:hypothetical protein [Coriobacteriaceae bacterium]